MAHLILECSEDFRLLQRHADDASLCIALTPLALTGIPTEWPAQRIVAPDRLFDHETRRALIAARLGLLPGLFDGESRGTTAALGHMLHCFAERQVMVDATALIHGEKRFVDLRGSAIVLEPTCQARFAPLLMRGRPQFTIGGHAAPSPHDRILRLASTPCEIHHPEISVLRALLHRAGIAAHAPLAGGARFDGQPPFPSGRLWFGRWPQVRLLTDWPSSSGSLGRAPTLGVVIPVHNAADHIEATVNCIRAGLARDDRIVVVENGSRDESWAMLQARFGNDPALILKRLGEADAAAARSLGVALCETDYVAFCDADDRWSGWKPSLVREVLRRTGAEILHHPMLTVVDGAPRIEGAGFLINRLPQTKTLLGDLLIANFLTTSALVVRRDLFAAPAFSAGLTHTQDYEAWCQLALRHPRPLFAWLDETLTFYRHWGGLSRVTETRLVNVSGIVRRYARHLPAALRTKVLLRNAGRVLRHSIRSKRPMQIVFAALGAPPHHAIRKREAP